MLSYERVHDAAISATCRSLNTYYSSWLHDLIEYGPRYLTESELDRRTQDILGSYYYFLALSVLERRDDAFWEYHKRMLAECGIRSHIFGWRKALLGSFWAPT